MTPLLDVLSFIPEQAAKIVSKELGQSRSSWMTAAGRAGLRLGTQEDSSAMIT